MESPRINAVWVVGLVSMLVALACAERLEDPALEGQDVKLTFLHTSDIHARLFPFRMNVIYTDETLGLDQENEPFGGIAKLAYIVGRERAKNERVLYLDTGDYFQGAPVFNAFMGEAEVRAMSYLSPDATVIGNHEFDTGLTNLTNQLARWATFPILAANYLFEGSNRLGDLAKPYVIVQSGGVRVGIIGLANVSSMSSITDVGNKLGIVPLNLEQTIAYWVDLIRPNVDLIVVASHAGYSHDEDLVRCSSGIDIVFGGHTHLALVPPKVIKDATGREVLVVHSGAFAKYLGKLDVVVRDGEIISHTYDLFPIDKTVPEDAKMVELLEPYRLELNQRWDLVDVYSFADTLLTKYGPAGGDSAMGNLVAEAMRKYARTDLAFNNTLGIRANVYPGPITREDLFNVFPFENTVTTVTMSGRDILEMLDYSVQRSAGRGCNSQIQVAGLEFTQDCNRAPNECFCYYEYEECPGMPLYNRSFEVPMRCMGEHDVTPIPEACHGACECPDGATRISECRCPPMARDVVVTSCSDPLIEDTEGCEKKPLVLDQMYEAATNDYIAKGGSGFTMLKSNSSQVDTGVAIRDAVLERLVTAEACVERCRDESGSMRIRGCETYESCVDLMGSYYDSFCDDVDRTSEERPEKIERCAVGPYEDCRADRDCYDIPTLCADDGCELCSSSIQCAEGEGCVEGHCVPDTMRCVDAACFTRCDEDADCQDEGPLGESFSLCVDGVCQLPRRQPCMDDAECASGTAMCNAANPRCITTDDCDGALVCRMGFCQAARAVCGSNADCASGVVCAYGFCNPDAIPCASSEDCHGGACVKGACNFACGDCTASDDCPDGLVCAEHYCVAPAGACREHRCRAFCGGDAHCLPDERCTGGVCTADACLDPQSHETRCRMDALTQAGERCLDVPCIRSEVDGRIQRILPDYTSGFYSKVPLADPEDFNPDAMGMGGM